MTVLGMNAKPLSIKQMKRKVAAFSVTAKKEGWVDQQGAYSQCGNASAAFRTDRSLPHVGRHTATFAVSGYLGDASRCCEQWKSVSPDSWAHQANVVSTTKGLYVADFTAQQFDSQSDTPVIATLDRYLTWWRWSSTS